MEESAIATFSQTLGKFLAELSFEKLPQEVVNQAKNSVLDTLGTSILGSKTEASKLFVKTIRTLKEPQESSIIVYGERTSTRYAAYVNTIMAAYLELDNGHTRGAVHPGCVTIPSALAMGEFKDISGKDFLTAVVAGHETIIRTAISTQPAQFHRGTDPSGTCGTLGSAAVAGKILGLDEREMANALGIACMMTPLSPLEWVHTSSMAKSLHLASASYAGILSALLAANRVTSPSTILEGVEGFFRATTFPEPSYPERMVEGLGEKWETGSVYYKFHSSCRWTHTAVDIALSLRSKYRIKVKQIERIVVRTYPEAATLSEAEPEDDTTARFSIPYTVAVALVDGRVGPEQFSKRKLKDEEILLVAKKVILTPDPALDYKLAKRPAEVTIKLKDGREYSEYEDNCFGDCSLKGTKYYPSDDVIVEKFMDLAGGVFGLDRLETIKDFVKTIEDAKTVRGLVELLY